MEIETLDLHRSGGDKPTCAPTFESSPAGPFTYALEYGLWKIFFFGTTHTKGQITI